MKKVSLWFCSDYGWQNVGKVRNFALILLGLWLVKRWQSEKFRFDFARIMVGRTLAKWEVSLWFCSDYGWQNVGKVKNFALILLGLWLAERWQSEKFRFDFTRILAERWQSEKFRFDFVRIMVGRTLAKLEVSLWFCSDYGWYNVGKVKKVSLWFCWDYGWQNVGKVRNFALILLGLWLAERCQS